MNVVDNALRNCTAVHSLKGEQSNSSNAQTERSCGKLSGNVVKPMQQDLDIGKRRETSKDDESRYLLN